MNNKIAGRSGEASPDSFSEEEEMDENELERRESRSRNEPPKLGLNFTEAVRQDGRVRQCDQRSTQLAGIGDPLHGWDSAPLRIPDHRDSNQAQVHGSKTWRSGADPKLWNSPYGR